MGPVRVNFSSSGIGLSAGVRGARVSVGPRGTYVTLSAGGFQYRQKLSDAVPQPQSPSLPQSPAMAWNGNIQTATVGELHSASPDQVLDSVSKQINQTDAFMIFAVVAGAVSLVLVAALPSPDGIFATALLSLLGIPVFLWDRERRTARLLYDIDDSALTERYAIASAAGESLATSCYIWHIYHTEANRDYKHHAGASTLIRRTSIRALKNRIPLIETNIEPWGIPIGPQRLVFLPDRLLVLEGNRLAGINYDDLSIEVDATRFIEDGSVPGDARQVGQTWQYVNKNGGPDRRFKQNRRLPIMEYGRIFLRSPSGVQVILHCSNLASAHQVESMLHQLQVVIRGQPDMAFATAPPAHRGADRLPVREDAPHTLQLPPPVDRSTENRSVIVGERCPVCEKKVRSILAHARCEARLRRERE
jgi:hypothetical protein